MSDTKLIPVAKGADYLEVHPATLADHQRVGWAVCEKREQEDPDAANKPADLTAAQIKEQLTAKGIEFKGNASKADLQALLDAANKPADPV